MATYEAFQWIKAEIKSLGEQYVYVADYNDDYDNIVSFRYYDTGTPNTIAFGHETAVRHLFFSVRVRDTSYENGYDRIEAIRNYFKAYSYQIISIYPKSDIINGGKDDKKRSIFYCNFYLNLTGGNTVTA